MNNQQQQQQLQHLQRLRRRQERVVTDTADEAKANLKLLLCLIGTSMILVLFAPKTLLLEEVLFVCASPAVLLLLLLARAGGNNGENGVNGSEGIALVSLKRRSRDEIEEKLITYQVPDEYIGMNCDICQDDYELGDDIAESPNAACVHRFHTQCISEWLIQNDDCPICRRDYLKTAQEVQDDVERKERDHARTAREDDVEVDLECGVVGNDDADHCEDEELMEDVKSDESRDCIPVTAAAVTPTL